MATLAFRPHILCENFSFDREATRDSLSHSLLPLSSPPSNLARGPCQGALQEVGELAVAVRHVVALARCRGCVDVVARSTAGEASICLRLGDGGDDCGDDVNGGRVLWRLPWSWRW